MVLSSYNFFVNIKTYVHRCRGTRFSQVALVVKNLTANAGDIRDAGSVPGVGRSPGRGHGNPVFLPENPQPGELQSMGS